MDTADTKTKILDVAEKLFAENGIQATSIRQIVSEAGVNVASVHYHFGSKESLLQKIISRRIGPITSAKLKRLDEIEQNAAGQIPDLDNVLRAFIEPHINMQRVDKEKVKIIMKLLVQLEDNTNFSELMQESAIFEVTQRYLKVLHQIFPGLSPSELHWRFKFIFGCLHALMVGHSLPPGTTFNENDADSEDLLNFTITFLKAGMSTAPVLKNRENS